MDPRAHLTAYIERKGGVAAAARALGVPYQSLRGIAAGWRGISAGYAERLANNSSGELRADVLVWVRATRATNDPEAGNG